MTREREVEQPIDPTATAVKPNGEKVDIYVHKRPDGSFTGGGGQVCATANSERAVVHALAVKLGDRKLASKHRPAPKNPSYTSEVKLDQLMVD